MNVSIRYTLYALYVYNFVFITKFNAFDVFIYIILYFTLAKSGKKKLVKMEKCSGSEYSSKPTGIGSKIIFIYYIYMVLNKCTCAH